jgi:hypothetical protein
MIDLVQGTAHSSRSSERRIDAAAIKLTHLDPVGIHEGEIGVIQGD